MSAKLIILGAAYGPRDVTTIVRGKITHQQTLSFTASYKTLGGDPWHGVKKTFVLVYKYSNEAADASDLFICKEDDPVDIHQ